MKTKWSVNFIFQTTLLSLAILAVGCQSAPAAPAVTATSEPAITPQPDFTPTIQEKTVSPAADIQLAGQPYQSPSGTYSINFPLGMTCEEDGIFRIDCQSASGDAVITVDVIVTGYELLQEHFEALVQAETVYAYGDKRAYIEENFGVTEGQISIDATWREEGVDWASRDRFIRQGAGVLHINLRALRERWADYLPVFQQSEQSAQFEPLSLYSAPLYAQRRLFSARDGLFTLDVPTAWMKYAGPLNIEGALVEGFLAPDLRAQVQVAVYRRDSLIEQADRILLTQDIMRALYGSDVRYTHYKALPDGRERGEWYAERRAVSGISFNGTNRNYLYIYSVVWDEVGKDLYMPVLDEVLDSFAR
jgi:hypothetical protein